MVTARARYLQRILRDKHGAIGYVAGLYVGAGRSVELMHKTRFGPIHIVVRGGGGIFAIEVVDKPGLVDLNVVKNLLEKAKLLKAKPILVLYSDGPILPEDVYKFCAENGIKIRRAKPEDG